jgi:hypothetical protein
MRRKPQRVIYEDHEFKVLDSTERSLCPLTRAVLVDAVRRYVQLTLLVHAPC